MTNHFPVESGNFHTDVLATALGEAMACFFGFFGSSERMHVFSRMMVVHHDYAFWSVVVRT